MKADPAFGGEPARFEVSEHVGPSDVVVSLDGLVAFGIVDQQGDLVHVSDRWCELTGWERHEVIGSHWRHVVHPAFLHQAVDAGRGVIRAMGRPGQVFRFEGRIQSRSGKETWVEANVSALVGADGEVRNWLLVADDVTAHHEAADALRRSERRLQAIMDHTLDTVVLLGPDGPWRTVSPEAMRRIGFEDETFPWNDPMSVVAVEDRPALLEWFAALAGRSDARTTEPIKYRVQPPGKEVRWLESRGVNLQQDPAVGSLVVHSRDVTEAHKSAEELQLMAGRLSSLVSHLFVATLLADEEGNIIYTNQAADELFRSVTGGDGLTQQSPRELRTSLRGLFLDYESNFSRILEILRRRETVKDERVELADGRLLARSFIPIFGDHGAYRGHIWLFRDVGAEVAVAAEREHLLAIEKEQNARLKELDALKSDLLASVSHELRTPLTSIVSFTHLLRSELPDEAIEHREFVDVIARNSHRLLGLIDDLMLLDRLESNTLELIVEDVNLPALVESAVATVRPEAERLGIVLSTQMADGPSLRGDVERLRVMVDHLLGNAIKFSDRQGTIAVRVAHDSTAWRLQVRDQGMGIPRKEIDGVLQRFYRASNARRLAIAGSGLGLPIAHRVAVLHHGSMEVTSRPGRGTTVNVVLGGAGDDWDLDEAAGAHRFPATGGSS